MKKYILTFCIASLSFCINETNGQIFVTTGCGEVQFGNSCNFKASGTLGGSINWVVTNGSWDWTPPRNPGTPWNIDTDKESLSATCRAYPSWDKQSMIVTINSNGYSASVSLPVACYSPRILASDIQNTPMHGFTAASAVAISKFGKNYGSELPGPSTGNVIHYPNGWQYIEDGIWKPLVTHENQFASPTGIKLFIFKQCLIVDSTKWDTDISTLRFLTIPVNFKGITIRKWAERCSLDTTFGSELNIPMTGMAPQQSFHEPRLLAYVQISSSEEMIIHMSNNEWKPISIITLIGRTLPIYRDGNKWKFNGVTQPGYYRIWVSNGREQLLINPSWVE
jgi:hypothetical protein